MRVAESIADEVRVEWDRLGDGSDKIGLESLRTLEAIAVAHRVAGERSEAAVPGNVLFRWGPLLALDKLGEGGFGEVYRAWEPSLRREVALKLRRADSGGSDDARRWLDEARRLARVRHPNVLVVHGAGTWEGRAGIWTALLEGATLEAWLAEHGPCSADEGARVGAELCRALAAVHGAGLVHADVKTTNVMRETSHATDSDPGRIVLMDFGAARELDAEGGSAGTPLAVAPEVLAGGAPTPRSDLYSLGVVLYRLATGRFPVVAASLRELRERLPAWEHVPLRTLRPDLPQEFVDAVERALEADPARRVATPAELEHELVQVLARARPARAPEAPPDRVRLPSEPTSFVGREREIADCRDLLGRFRLLTITGAGGCGKTRLACRVAATLGDGDEEVRFVALAALQGADHVPGMVAAALESRERADASPEQALVEHLAGRRVVIVLDNCEHLVAVVARLVRLVLDGCDGVRVIATSREPLGVPGEALYTLSPLNVPDPGVGADAGEASRHESVRLFVERAGAVVPDFTLDVANVGAVVEICRRVDGIPLAIELAAARLRTLAPGEIAARLDRPLQLLRSPSAAVDPRHATLRAAVAWSVDPLDPGERHAFERLAVFGGGWTLESAAAVLDLPADASEVVDRIDVLVNRSLAIAAPGAGGPMRYRYLEPIRRFGLERLASSGDEDTIRARHLEFFLGLASKAHDGLEGGDQGRWVVRLDEEHENMLAAIDHAARSAETAEAALMLAASLVRYWNIRGHVQLGANVLERLLALPAARTPTLARARALQAAGTLMAASSRWQERALPHLTEAVGIFRAVGDPRATAHSLNALAAWISASGRYDEGMAMWSEVEDLFRASGDRQGEGRAIHNRAVTTWNRGDLGGARELFERCLTIWREVENHHHTIHADVGLTFLSVRLGDLERARASALEGLRIVGALRARSASVAGLLLASGELSVAIGRHALAAKLFGVAETLLEGFGLVFTPDQVWWSERERCAAAIRAALGEEAAARADAEGRSLSLDAAVAMAVEELGAVSG